MTYEARALIERLGGEVVRRRHNAHKQRKPLRLTDEVALQVILRRGDDQPAAAQ